MIEHYLTSSEATKFVEKTIAQPVNYYDLDNLIRSGDIESPRLIAGRRMWSKENLREACTHIRIRRAKRPAHAAKKRMRKKH